MANLTKFERETILLTSDGDDTYDIFTYNNALKRKLANYANKYPQCCQLKTKNDLGGVTYVIDKAQVSIRLMAPCSEERRKASSDRAQDKRLSEKIKRGEKY